MGVAAPSFSAPHLTKAKCPGQGDAHEIRGCGRVGQAIPGCAAGDADPIPTTQTHRWRLVPGWVERAVLSPTRALLRDP